MHTQDPIQQLIIFDPEFAKIIINILKQKPSPVSHEDTATLVDESLWGFSQEISFGYALAKGYAGLMGEAAPEDIRTYRGLVRDAIQKGPTLGWIMATYLVPVLKTGNNGLLESFLRTTDIMQTKGTYTLKKPLKSLSSLLNTGDTESGRVYLGLLHDTFSQKLTYNQSLHLTHTLPKSVLSFSPLKRRWQIEQFRRVIKADFRLIHPFLDGMEKGLHLLTEKALEQFVSLGLEKFQRSRTLSIKFFALESKTGIDAYNDMVVAVSLSQIQPQLNRYLRAVCCPLSAVRCPSAFAKNHGPRTTDHEQPTTAYSDGRFIYLPEEISLFDNKSENLNLYKCLTKLEAAYYEFGTFDFDTERWEMGNWKLEIRNPKSEIRNLSDLECFFLRFPIKALASDLFNIFEQGRIRLMLARFYPGIVRQYFDMLRDEAMCIYEEEPVTDAIFLLYVRTALGVSAEESFSVSNDIREAVSSALNLFENKMAENDVVETCADLVFLTYHDMESLITTCAGCERLEDAYIPLRMPFGRQLRPDLFFSAHQNFERMAERLKVNLEEKNLKAYKSDIRKRLTENSGDISVEEIREIVECRMGDATCSVNISAAAIRNILIQSSVHSPQLVESASDSVAWHKEWDCNLGDYLYDHVRVLDKFVTSFEDDFYLMTLERYQGIVKQIRHAFELLKPEGLTLLRQWKEGDEFDYRALLDFAMDKKAGIMPSDRLYIKRIKQQRDVAVLLLADLSRSTSNIVPGTSSSVLDIEKEAIVLFCEALEVVGDAYAIAGFSGTGRLGVDYFRIKDFDDIMDDSVRGRISAVSPQRSTRMGAAIRHAACQLEKVSAKVRLLIIIGDGFPNDTDYKREYAVEDTRKAIFEGRSKNIHTRAITVNLAGDSKLDDLYGALHHNVISDVRELPDKLLRIYSALTR